MRNVTKWAVLTVLGAGAGAMAQQKPGSGPEPANVETAVYNVGDLVGSVPSYPYSSNIVSPGGLGMGSQPMQVPGGPMMAVPPFQPVSIEQLLKLIESTVAPTTWRDNGGDVGALTMFGSGIVVTQTPDNQKRIQQLLTDIGREVGLATQTVSVHLVWINIKPGELTNFLSKEHAGLLDMDSVVAHPEMIWNEARILCYSGQKVSLSSGQARTVLTQVTPVVAQQAVGYEETTKLMQSGLAIEVTPVISKDDVTTLDVKSEYSNLAPAPATQPATRPEHPEIDRVELTSQQIATTVRVPMNAGVLVGGMTLDPTAGGRQVYLVAEVKRAGEK